MSERHNTEMPFASPESTHWLDSIRWNDAGLVPAVAQDSESGQILMMAWMNRESLQETAATRTAVYFSRSRQRLWRKGESSGHTQRVISIRLDCDEDVILLSVEQLGGIACHTGRAHCFYRTLTDGVWETTDAVLRDPAEIYAEASDPEPVSSHTVMGQKVMGQRVSGHSVMDQSTNKGGQGVEGKANE